MNVGTLFDDVKRMNKRQVLEIFTSWLTSILIKCILVSVSGPEFCYDSIVGVNDLEGFNSCHRE